MPPLPDRLHRRYIAVLSLRRRGARGRFDRGRDGRLRGQPATDRHHRWTTDRLYTTLAGTAFSPAGAGKEGRQCHPGRRDHSHSRDGDRGSWRFAAFVYYSDRQTANTTPTPTPAPVNSSVSDRETAELREKLANLQRQVDRQKNARTAGNTGTAPSSTETTRVTADSPGDGFLALRSEPNSETGARLAKIPHGTAFTIGSCLDYKITSRGNRGRWCTANYNGQTGWVFDAFVKY